MFFYEFDPNTFAGECLHNSMQVILVASESIHAMNDKRISTSHKTHHQFQLRPLGILAGCFVGKGTSSSN
jgi:hypothetical protein